MKGCVTIFHRRSDIKFGIGYQSVYSETVLSCSISQMLVRKSEEFAGFSNCFLKITVTPALMSVAINISWYAMCGFNLLFSLSIFIDFCIPDLITWVLYNFYFHLSALIICWENLFFPLLFKWRPCVVKWCLRSPSRFISRMFYVLTTDSLI